MRKEEFKTHLLPVKGKIYRLALTMLSSRTEAEDTVQDVYVKLWNMRQTLAEYKSIEALAVTITKNLCIDKLRSYRSRNQNDGGLEVMTLAGSERYNPEQQAELNESMERVQSIINRLPDQQRMVLHLRDIEQYTYDEIEKMADMKRNNIRVMLSRARKTVRNKYFKQQIMKIEKVNQLISKYESGETSLEEEQKLRAYFKSENIPKELKPQADLFRKYDEIRAVESSEKFNPLAKIDLEEEAENSPLKKGEGITAGNSRGLLESGTNISTKFTWLLRIAAGFILMLIGFAAGQFLDNEDYASTQQVAQLEREVQQMKRALMNTGNYQQASAGERLSAVNISAQIPVNDSQLDQQITDILIYTLNNDESVNVRLAAAEALFRFSNEPPIKRALTASLNKQQDPLVQITLIDMLVELRATNAINEMKKMLVNSNTQELVRKRLQTGIAELQT